MRFAALVVVLAGVAAADAPTPPPRVDVEVGKTVEANVGYIRGGWMCDDPSLVTAELVTRNDTNYWIVTGKKAGTTQCRIGSPLHPPYIVYDLVVTTPAPKKAPK